jgi:hypothetical protein
VAWGSNDDGECNVPVPNAGFVRIAAGYGYSLGLKADGTIVAWGRNDRGQCDIPEPNSGFVGMAGGWYHVLGLRSDGTIVAWGDNYISQGNVPDPNSNFVAVAAGEFHSLGLRGPEWPTPVQVTEATAEARPHDVLIRWRTPLDVQGVSFNVYRSEVEDSDGGSEISERLTRDPLMSLDGTYEFVDTNVHSNHDYEYNLEMLTGGSAPEVVRTLQVHFGRLGWVLAVRGIRPNPVIGPCTIALEIPKRGHVSLDLVDVGGRWVRTLADTEMDEGVHELALDLRHGVAGERPLAAGVYYAVLRFKGRVERKQIIVMP